MHLRFIDIFYLCLIFIDLMYSILPKFIVPSVTKKAMCFVSVVITISIHELVYIVLRLPTSGVFSVQPSKNVSNFPLPAIFIS